MKIVLLVFSFTLWNSLLVERIVSLSLISNNIRYRKGRWQDLLGINIELLFQSDVSTSISLDSNEFIIAEDQEDGSSSSSVVVAGWAQLRCLGPATSIWDPNQWYDDNDGRMTVVNTTTTNNNNSRRENEYLLEKEVDEIMWEEFEDDPMEFPNG